MIYTYRFISTLLYPVLVILIFFRKFLNKEDRIRFKEKIFSSTFLKSFNDQKKLIWFMFGEFSICGVGFLEPYLNPN